MLRYIIINNNFTSYSVFLEEIYLLANIISNKYLIICFVVCIYFEYSSINDKIIHTSYTSDNHKDYILISLLKNLLNTSKFSIHYINNKVLHPITLFLQNL